MGGDGAMINFENKKFSQIVLLNVGPCSRQFSLNFWSCIKLIYPDHLKGFMKFKRMLPLQ